MKLIKDALTFWLIGSSTDDHDAARPSPVNDNCMCCALQLDAYNVSANAEHVA